jgi:hypothetical protein
MAVQHQSPSVLVLFRGWEDHGCYVWSPFVTKVEFRLRLSNVPYTAKAGSPLTAPTGKIPYVNLGTDEAPALLGDSTLIISRLVELGKLEDLNEAVSASEKVQDLALRALLEDKLYFYHVRFNLSAEQVSVDLPCR